MRSLLLALALAGCTSSYQVSYSIEKDERSDIYVVNGRGHWRHRATRGPHHSRDAALSPDGRWLVYVAEERAPGSPKRLALIDEDWDDPRFIPLPPGEPRNPSFHPNGDRLVLAFAPKGGVPQIHVCRLDGGDWTRIGSDDQAAEQPVFSPDATKIAFVRSSGAGASGIWMMDSRTGAGARRLSRPGEVASGPAFRPDGKALAWSSLAAGSSIGNIVVLDLGTGTLAQRTFFSDPEGALHPCFSDDGRTIAFLKVEARTRLLGAVEDRDGSRPTELARHPGIRIDRLSSSIRP